MYHGIFYSPKKKQNYENFRKMNKSGKYYTKNINSDLNSQKCLFSFNQIYAYTLCKCVKVGVSVNIGYEGTVEIKSEKRGVEEEGKCKRVHDTWQGGR